MFVKWAAPHYHGRMSDERNGPATKGDIQDLRAEFLAEIDGLRAESKSMEDRLVEAFRDGQTEMLKAFYNYTQTSGERIASTESETVSVKKRLAILESRIQEVERRLNTPPAA